MDVKTFVSATIQQIIDGTVEAQEYARDKGALVNPVSSMTGATDVAGGFLRRYDGYVPVRLVRFDLAVTAEESSAKGGEAGLKVLSVGRAGGSMSSASSNTSTSRVSFEVGLALPAVPDPKHGQRE